MKIDTKTISSVFINPETWLNIKMLFVYEIMYILSNTRENVFLSMKSLFHSSYDFYKIVNV